MNTKFKVGDRVIWRSDRTRGGIVTQTDDESFSVDWDHSRPMLYLHDEPYVTSASVVHDLVNHPAHYTGHPTIEAIDVLEHVQDYRLGTAMKYIWRVAFGGKDNNRQDIEKAIWYLNRWLERNDAVSDA